VPARALPAPAPVPLATVLREWGRLGCIGFGGPPAHIALLRELCVRRRAWLTHGEFEDAIAACNLLPGPASTQLAIFCAWRVRGPLGALVGGAAFIAPGLAAIVALAALFLAGSPPVWVRGAGAGAGAAVAAVAVRTGTLLLAASRARAVARTGARFWGYLVVGVLAAATVGPWLVLALLACGAVQVLWPRGGARGGDGDGLDGEDADRGGVARGGARAGGPAASLAPPPLALVAAATAATGGLGALVWVALKVGALSYGGGFVIVPLMQHDAVSTYHWMTAAQFLNAVALGQVTPGPLVQTVAVVGYAAAGVGGALLAAVVAFAPSFVFVLGGARHFDALRASSRVQAFLGGAAPAAIGAILGSAVPLALALSEGWQVGVLAVAAGALLVARRGVVATLLAAGVVGGVLGVAGAPLPH
jgi:chromate transporter